MPQSADRNVPVVIIHGWSDSKKSFKRLAGLIRKGLGRRVNQINLADWVSLNDKVSFADLREALERAWQKKGLPTSPRSVDVVVHSTGALVVRDWMTDYWTPPTCPIKRFVMLAPANYGSPLAHKGRAFIGRIIKGWSTGLETGTHILRGLELASPYSWELAEKDVFAQDEDRWYGQGRIMATVLVGNRGYGGVRSAANEDGSDGTVRISTANLNATKYHLDFWEDFDAEFSAVTPAEESAIAFGIMDGETHGSIIAKTAKTPKNPATMDFILDALRVSPQGWKRWRKRVADHTASIVEDMANSGDSHLDLFQNTVVHVLDHLGQPVDDYFVEFKVNDDDEGLLSSLFNREALHTVHTNAEDNSYRSFYINCTKLREKINKPGESLQIGLYANPQYNEQKGALVGYSTKRHGSAGELSLDYRQVGKLFLPNRTILLEITIERKLSGQVFTIETAAR